MSYLFFEMSAWLLAVFTVGLLLGAWIGYACRSDSKEENSSVSEVEVDAPVASSVQVKEVSESEEDDSDDVVKDTDDEEVANEKPANLISETAQQNDDLKQLKGVGPKLEILLNEIGIFNFQQIADWKQNDIDGVNEKLSFSGRIEREDWVSQARILSEGGTTDFSKQYQKDD